MAKNSKILTPGGLSLSSDVPLLGEINPHPRSPLVTGVKPCGSQVLIEILTAQELANTNITISEKTDLKVPLQGYVRAVGPGFKGEEWGFKVGDRVLISGGGVMAPAYDDCHRDRFFMEPHSVKSVLIEAA
jgi:co-chaperonin GroES (HSP10)